MAIFAVIFSTLATFFRWITTDSNSILDSNIFKISFNFECFIFYFYPLKALFHHNNTCNKILVIFIMYTLYCTYLHLQKGKISSEVWTKSDNHRDCVVLRPRSISLVIVRVCHASYHSREKERDRCVYIHKGELPSGASQWLYLSLKHFHNCLLLHSCYSLSPSLSVILYKEKDEWKYSLTSWKNVAMKAEQIMWEERQDPKNIQ